MKKTKQDNYSRQCEGTRKDGSPCTKFAVRGEQFCHQHLIGEEAWRELSRKGGFATGIKKRANAAPRVRSGLNPQLSLEDVFEIANEGLRATFADAGLPGQIDWSTRLLSALVLLHTFPLRERKTPEQAQALLERALPTPMPTDAEMKRRLRVQDAYREARREWDKLRIRYTPLVGLYVEPYPPSLIAPWENREQVLSERPAPIPADSPDIRRVGPGVLWEREDDLPMLVPHEGA